MIFKLKFPRYVKYYLPGMSPLHTVEEQDKYLTRIFRTTALKAITRNWCQTFKPQIPTMERYDLLTEHCNHVN